MRLLAYIPRLRPRGRGPQGERAAARHLKKQSYRILGRNLRTRFGEVDLLAQAPDGRTIVVVEVKAGAGRALPAEVHLTRDKQRRLTALAGQLLRRHRLTDRPVRFDLVVVQWQPGERKPDIRHHVHAFNARV